MVKTQTIAFYFVAYLKQRAMLITLLFFIYNTKNNINTITFERRPFMKNKRFNTPPFMGGYDIEKTKINIFKTKVKGEKL